MAESALRAIDQSYMMGIGQGPAPARVPRTRGQTTADILGAASLPMSAVPIAGDITGLAADAAMYAAYPEERTMGNYAMSALGVLPLVPGVAAVRAARGASPLEGTLDMSQAARMQRAAEQGFDVNTPVYHGSGTEFDAFDSGRLGENTGYGDASVGFHFSDNKADADFYASKAGERLGTKGVVRPFFLDLKNPLVVGLDEFDGNAGLRTQEFLDDKLAAKAFAEDNGHDGIIYPYGTNVDSGYTAIAFRPEQIRSTSAAFDPAKRGSANLMAGAAGATIGLSALRNIQRDEERQPD